MNPLTPIESVLTALLEWIHSTIGLPWAWAVIALTLLVRVLIVPLTVKQIRSMQHLQQHAPELKAIQQKYKQDKQRQQEEIMRFYRENKINPASACLPILVQIPIFIALFFVLRDFETEVFPDYPGSDLGWLGIVPNITTDILDHWSGWFLLVIYVVSQMASIISMPTTDPRQRWIFLAMPLVFVLFIVYIPSGQGFPIGLMLYWVTTNLWTVGQGIVTRRLVPKPPPPQKRSSRTPPKHAAPEPAREAGDGQPKPTAQQQRVRRRKKKKGPRARR
jgi:YidC/Oxa1 family membrane protein insertase